jgi:hypothetical protein
MEKWTHDRFAVIVMIYKDIITKFVSHMKASRVTIFQKWSAIGQFDCTVFFVVCQLSCQEMHPLEGNAQSLIMPIIFVYVCVCTETCLQTCVGYQCLCISVSNLLLYWCNFSIILTVLTRKTNKRHVQGCHAFFFKCSLAVHLRSFLCFF